METLFWVSLLVGRETRLAVDISKPDAADGCISPIHDVTQRFVESWR
jgi:hypothetical protein